MKKFSDKWARVHRRLLKVSFLPYGVVLLWGLHGAVFGVSGFMSTSYGVDGFFWGVLGMALVLTIVPVIPVCVVFQVASAVMAAVGKFSVPPEDAGDGSADGNKNPAWVAFAVIAVLGVVVFGALLARMYVFLFG